MRKLLISINIVLGFLVLWGFFRNLAAGAASRNTLVKPLPINQNLKTENSKKGSKTKLPPLDEAAKKITALDIFNNVRSPLANVRNGRTQLTLVGTFRCGKIEGAIIKQNSGNRQFNPYLAQMMMAGGMGRPGGMGGGRFTRWSQVSGRNAGAEKQYVRVGETLSNGYTLAEITRTGATLIRGNDRLELELQDPSKNRSSGNRNSGRRLNATQQFQQAQMIMQGQMMRTMRDMQRSIQASGGGGNRGGARR